MIEIMIIVSFTLYCLLSLSLYDPVRIELRKDTVFSACLMIILNPEYHNYDSYPTSNPRDSNAYGETRNGRSEVYTAYIQSLEGWITGAFRRMKRKSGRDRL